MLPRPDNSIPNQPDIFTPFLRDIVSPRHSMVKLADSIDWQSLEDGLSECFCTDNGRPSCPARLMVALQYLKYASGLSNEAVLNEWLNNSYWQHFTGGVYFEHSYPTAVLSGKLWIKN